MMILVLGEKQIDIGCQCSSVFYFIQFMICYIQWALGTLQCFRCWIVFAPLVNKATWAAPGIGALSGEAPQNSEEKINGINENHLVDRRPWVRPLISLLLKLPFNVLCDATREKCRVNGCHAPTADITFFFLTLAENMSQV